MDRGLRGVRDLVTFVSTIVFRRDDLALESGRRFASPGQSDVEASLIAEEFELVEIRDARSPRREFVFLARRTG